MTRSEKNRRAANIRWAKVRAEREELDRLRVRLNESENDNALLSGNITTLRADYANQIARKDALVEETERLKKDVEFYRSKFKEQNKEFDLEKECEKLKIDHCINTLLEENELLKSKLSIANNILAVVTILACVVVPCIIFFAL